MRTIVLANFVGSFAESKEQAKYIRTKLLLPALRKGEEVELDFDGVNAATQSFVHALAAEGIRLHQPFEGIDLITFKNCSENVKSIIEIVVSYCQDDWSDTGEVQPLEAQHVA